MQTRPRQDALWQLKRPNEACPQPLNDVRVLIERHRDQLAKQARPVSRCRHCEQVGVFGARERVGVAWCAFRVVRRPL